jgi:hypothetical protein
MRGIYTGTFPDGNMVRRSARPSRQAVHQAEEIVRKYSMRGMGSWVAAIAEILMEQERLWGLLADGRGHHEYPAEMLEIMPPGGFMRPELAWAPIAQRPVQARLVVPAGSMRSVRVGRARS